MPRTSRGRPGGRRYAGSHEVGGEADCEPRPDLPPHQSQMPLWVVFVTDQPPSAPKWVRCVPLMSRLTAGRKHCDPELTRSGRQPETTLGPTSLQNGTTGAGGHPVSEPVLLRTLAIVWLKSSFHPCLLDAGAATSPPPFGLARLHNKLITQGHAERRPRGKRRKARPRAPRITTGAPFCAISTGELLRFAFRKRARGHRAPSRVIHSLWMYVWMGSSKMCSVPGE